MKPRHAIATLWLVLAFASFAFEFDALAGFWIGSSLSLWLKWSWIKEHA